MESFMRHSFLTATALGGILAGLMAVSVQAGNVTVENALRDRPDLSTFYQGLVSTGVINELKEEQSYTVFAPTNHAFAQVLPYNQYPCFYSQACRPQVAEILRNHIVTGERHLSDIGQRQGGAMSMFAIDHHHIVGSEPRRNSYAVDGNNVLSENQLMGSVLYRVDGIIATPREMAGFATSQNVMVYVPGTDLPPRVPAGSIVTITETTEH
jgi:uncharacterized surface protein with fasciclin (FAS1) repeats